MEWIDAAEQVFDYEIQAALLTKKALGASFEALCVEIDECQGDIILTGMGKSGHVCKKIAATMRSLGIKAHFLHPAEALHGDLGMLGDCDLVITLSKSGETSELLSILPAIKKLGASVFSIIGRPDSTLESFSDKVLLLPNFGEAYLDNIVPTSSTTVMLMLGDALAVAVASKRNFEKKDFGVFHPGGMLGKRLTLQVQSLMKSGEENAVVLSDASVKDAVLEMCQKTIGGVSIIAEDGSLMGVFTDGDLRRLCKKDVGALDTVRIDSVMTKKPIILSKDELVAEVVERAKKCNDNVSFYPVVEKGKLIGSLSLLDISKSGLL